MNTFQINEKHLSQIPALQLLMGLGFEDSVVYGRRIIDYPVTHELCHLKYHDHSPIFYKLLDSVTPGREKIKHKLEVSMS